MILSNKNKMLVVFICFMGCIMAGSHTLSARPLKTKLDEKISQDTVSMAVLNNFTVQSYPYFSPKPYNYPVFNKNNSATSKKLAIQPLGANSTSSKGLLLGQRFAGRFLLQVEGNGALWYIDKKEFKKHSVTWENAISLFQKYAIGISNNDLVRIETDLSGISKSYDSDNDGHPDWVEMKNKYNPYDPKPKKISISKTLSKRLSNSFLIQTEQGGALWYVDNSGIKHLVKQETLMSIFTKLAVGISNSDLITIPGE